MNTTRLNKFLTLFLFALFIQCIWVSASQAQLVSKSGKNWNVNFNINGIYADNLAQNPRGTRSLFTQDSDTAFNWSGSAAYVHKFNEKISLKANYGIDMTVYSELGQYDMTSNSWGLKPRYKLTDHSFVDLQYLYNWSIAGGTSFSGVNYLSPTYVHLNRTFGITRIGYFYQNNDNFVNQARDSDKHGFKFDHKYLFDNMRDYIGIGYSVSDEDAVGRFDRTVQSIKLSARADLWWGFQGTGRYKFSFRDYDTFASSRGGTREDTQHNFRLGLSRMLIEKWNFLRGITGSINWSRTTNFSNLTFREFTSNQIMGGLTANF